MFTVGTVGTVTIFLAIIGLFQILFSFGLGNAAKHFTSFMIGEGSKERIPNIVYKVILIGSLLGVLSFVSVFLLSPLLSFYFIHSYNYIGLVRKLGFVIFGYIIFSILNGVLIGLQNFRLSSVVSITVWLIYYIGSIVIVISTHSLQSMIIGWILGIYSGVLIELFILIRIISKFTSSRQRYSTKSIFVYSVPILLSNLIDYGAAYADRFIVAAFLSTASLGVYNFALLISAAMGLLVMPFNNILMSKFSESFGRSNLGNIGKNVKSSTLVLSSVFIPGALGISALSSLILYVLGGTSYLLGALPLTVIMFFEAAFVSFNILTQALSSIRETRVLFISSAASLFSNLGLSYLLIPTYGLLGAALGYSSVYVSAFLVLLFHARKKQLVLFDLKGFVKIWTSSLLMYVVLILATHFFSHLPIMLPFFFILGVISYAVFLFLLKPFSKEDSVLILSLFPENFNSIRKVFALFINDPTHQ